MKKDRRFLLFLAAVTLLKILLAGICTSDYEQRMFLPFVRDFLASPFENPYEGFLRAHGLTAFPYPQLMLAIETPGAALAGLAASPFLTRLCFKLPLFFFDFLGLFFLLRLYPRKRKIIGFLYFASPLLIFATYMHGQLDMIPTALLLGALFYLTRKGRGAVRFGGFLLAALLTKLHILAVLPLIAIYLWQRGDRKKQLAMAAAVTLAGLCVAAGPFSGAAFYESVLFNREQSLLTEVYLGFVDQKLYLPVLALLLIYVRTFMLRAINTELLLSLCGLLFGVFLLLIPPMPGWYVWIVPFLVVFFISTEENKYRNLFLYAALHAAYFLYFLTAQDNGWVNLYVGDWASSALLLHHEVYRNVVFTALIGTLFYLVFSQYRYGIATNGFYRRMEYPFAIGIAGDSGTGKSTLLGILKDCLGEKNILLIEGDGDHRWERGAEEWARYTHLNPKANFLYRQAKDIALLKKGAPVRRVEYDHSTGHFTREKRLRARRYILLSGLHAFYLPQMRRVIDLKIYMDTEERLRRYWKLRRDMGERGYSAAGSAAQSENRKEDSGKYILPQKGYADLVIAYSAPQLSDEGGVGKVPPLSLTFTLSSAIDAEPLLGALEASGIPAAYDFTENLRQQVIRFDGEALDEAKVDLTKIAAHVLPEAAELAETDFRHTDVRTGILQLIILLVIRHKLGEG